MVDDRRSKFLLSQDAVPKIAVPRGAVHEKREFALPAVTRGAAATSPTSAPSAPPETTAAGDERPDDREPAVLRDAHAARTADDGGDIRATPLDEEREGAGGEHEGADEEPRQSARRYWIAVALLLVLGALAYWWATRAAGDEPAAAPSRTAAPAATAAVALAPTVDSER